MKHNQVSDAYDTETVWGGTPDDEFISEPVLFPGAEPLISTPPPVSPPPEPRQKKEIDWTLPMPFAGGAEISPCKLYRYSLYRRWQEGGKKILFIGVNPSTADQSQDDATIRRLLGYAKRDGYGELWVGNVCAYRSTKPFQLRQVPANYNDEQNREYIRHMAVDADRIVACWGNNVTLCPHWQNFVTWLCTNYEVWCFGRTKSSHPKHPLRLRADTLYSRYYSPEFGDVVEKEDDEEFVCESETAAIQEFDNDEFR